MIKREERIATVLQKIIKQQFPQNKFSTHSHRQCTTRKNDEKARTSTKGPSDSKSMPVLFHCSPIIFVSFSDGKDLKCWPFIHLALPEKYVAQLERWVIVIQNTKIKSGLIQQVPQLCRIKNSSTFVDALNCELFNCNAFQKICFHGSWWDLVHWAERNIMCITFYEETGLTKFVKAEKFVLSTITPAQ